MLEFNLGCHSAGRRERTGCGRGLAGPSAGEGVVGRAGLDRPVKLTGPGFWDWAGMLGFAMGFPFLFPISNTTQT